MTGLAPLAVARWPDVQTADRQLLVLPVGSTEQHGPHLPLDTDTRIAVALAEELHRRHPTVGLGPAIGIGASGEHAHFPGTLSIGTEALAAVLVELVRHASMHWRQILVVNGHGGNLMALRRAQATCAYEGRELTVVHAGVSDGDAHAGRTETSVLLHLCPELVRMDLAEPGTTTPMAELLERVTAVGVRTVSANGVLGDPTGAAAAEGVDIFARMAERVEAAAGPLLGGGARA